MSGKSKEKAVIIRKEEISSGIFDIWIRTNRIAETAKAGQFTALYCKDGSRLLPRPISICEIDRQENAIRLVYRVVGKGTEEFSHMKEGMEIDLMGPLGNGFPLRDKAALIIGGGIGIPPMLELAKQLDVPKQAVLGFRDELFLYEDFKKYAPVYVATEDGSSGTKGNVLDAVLENGLKADVIYACGPLPMLRALKNYAAENGLECYVSLEERMACGIGACLGCVCRSKETDSHTNVKNKRICKEGPVFAAEEVDF